MLLEFLFSADGRVNRWRYWLFGVLSGVVLALASAASLALLFAAGGGLFAVPIGVLLLIFSLAMAYAANVLTIKRLHDRDKSGWWSILFLWLPLALGYSSSDDFGTDLLLGLAEVVITTWAGLELGCRRGTRGPNQYGPDPLASG